MKKIAAALLALVFLLALPGLALGEGSKHTIEEYDITVEIPDGYRMVTPDMDPDDPILALYGMTIEDIRDMFDTMPLYLDAVRTDGMGEITVTIQSSDLPDYRDLGQSALEVITGQMTAEFSSMGVEVLSTDYYTSDQTSFMRLYFKSAPTMDCGVQYYTVYNGKSYSFALHSYHETLPEIEDQLMKAFMESVSFNSMTEAAAPESEATVYADPNTGASFTVPENWKVEKMTKRDLGIQVTYSSLRDPSASITFVAGDLWEDATGTQKLFNTRGSFDDSKMTTGEAADIIGVSSDLVTRTEISGVQYWRADFTSSISQNGTKLEIPATCLLRVCNSNIYMFIYVGSPYSAAYTDFEAAVASAQYHDDPSASVAPIVYVLAAGAVIAVVIIILASRAKKKRLIEQEAEEARLREKYMEEYRKAQEEQRRMEEQQAAEAAKQAVCPKCGAVSEPGSKFCGSCGGKIEAGEEA